MVRRILKTILLVCTVSCLSLWCASYYGIGYHATGSVHVNLVNDQLVVHKAHYYDQLRKPGPWVVGEKLRTSAVPDRYGLLLPEWHVSIPARGSDKGKVTGYRIAVPLLGPAALCFLFSLVFVAYPHYRKHRRLMRGRCLHCGYDLRGSVERCSECGCLPPWSRRVRG